MSPFTATVFRIRLLLLACALGLMSAAGDKKTSETAQGAKPIKAVKATPRKPPPRGRIVAISEASQIAR